MENGIRFKAQIGEKERNIFHSFMAQTLRGEGYSQIYIFVENNAFGMFRYICLGGDIYRLNGAEYIGVAFDYYENKMYFLSETFDVVATLFYEER